jgi:hypothetical protein
MQCNTDVSSQLLVVASETQTLTISPLELTLVFYDALAESYCVGAGSA